MAEDRAGGAEPGNLHSAYRAGRDDERARLAKAPVDTRDRRWRDVYERGRRDERARRRGAPLLTLLLVLVAAIGGAFIYLAVREGSFARGGQVVDRGLGQAAQQASPAIGSAGQSLENAGRSLKQSASGLGQS
ncbi:MAG TPA: hypothetical protein VMU93_00080 [Caulobacteraceae bacterium]|nr:hypothetical protein [Caulobacteraceae bacterium]